MSKMIKIAPVIAISSLVFVTTTATIASASQTTWDTTATEYRGRLEQDFTYRCPSNGRVTKVWGTDIYTDDSSICSAAVHAGLITAKEGGNVTIRIKPGQSSYVGTTRNGVSSQDYGSFSGSFIFLNGNVAANSSENISTIPLLKWNVTATEHRGRLEQDFTYRCLPDGRVTRIWGTDIYTDDSSICSAAVHAGLISTKQGGEVTIRIKPGQSSYTGTNRNGVRSQDYGSFSGSFIFIK
jgi:LCCL domain